MAAAVGRRADPCPHRARAGVSHAPVLHERRHRAASQVSRDAGTVPRGAYHRCRAPAALLLGLPAQHLDPRARRQPRDGRHRLSLHGGLDGPRHRDLHADGRRGRDLDRSGAVHRDQARVPEYRRRHLCPLGHSGDSRRGRRRRQHHLQDPLQRRRGDDRRAGRRGQSHRRSRRRAAHGRRRQPDRDRQRSSGKPCRHEQAAGGRDRSPSASSRQHPARAARNGRRVGADLRSDLRRRAAPQAQARPDSIPEPPRRHQRARLRRLRRLQPAIQLPFRARAGDRSRPEAPHQSEFLQSGF